MSDRCCSSSFLARQSTITVPQPKSLGVSRTDCSKPKASHRAGQSTSVPRPAVVLVLELWLALDQLAINLLAAILTRDARKPGAIHVRKGYGRKLRKYFAPNDPFRNTPLGSLSSIGSLTYAVLELSSATISAILGFNHYATQSGSGRGCRSVPRHKENQCLLVSRFATCSPPSS